jgi:hypothetical protein
MADVVTPEDVKELFESLVEESPEESLTYNLMEICKNKVESELKLEILKDVDSTQTANPGDTYTSMKTLSDNARLLLKLTVGNIPYIPVSFVNRENFRSAARRYYVDWKNKQFALCGSIASSQTIRQYFLTKTTRITADNADDASTIVWPDEFKPLIAFLMARIYQGNIDPDDIAIRQGLEQTREATALLDAMIGWDHDIKLAAMGNVGGFASDQEGESGLDIDDPFNLAMM